MVKSQNSKYIFRIPVKYKVFVFILLNRQNRISQVCTLSRKIIVTGGDSCKIVACTDLPSARQPPYN